MRTIGSIEKVLVGGIVIVIGAILAVAIKGAGDFDAAQREKTLASAPTGGDKKDASAKSQPAKGAGAQKPNPGAGRTLRNDAPAVTPTGRGAGSRGGAAAPNGGAAAPNGVAAPDKDASPPSDSANLVPGGLNGAPASQPIDGGPAPVGGEQRGNGAHDPSSGNPDIDALLKQQRDALAGGPTGAAKSVRPEDIGDEAVVLADDADGKVKAPIVTDPPVVTPVAAPESWTYEVRSGDSLERIARALYGDGGEYHTILAVNPALADKNTIRVGQKLVLPRAPTQGKELAVKDLAAGAAPSVTTKPVADAERSTPAKVVKGSGFKRIGTAVEHIVASGDTLMSIALEHYGTKAAWRLIYDANTAAIPDKDRIKVGARFKLPAQ